MTAGPNRFAGKNVVVTGAAGDIGSATARQLAAEGARVALLDRDAARLHDVTEVIKTSGGVATAHSVDVTDEASVARVLGAAAADASGVIDGLFNNVGISGPVGPVTTLDLGEVEHALRVNVVGMLAVLKHCIPLMRRGGAIVQTGSTASLRGAPSMAAYIASKHAVLGLSQTAAKELAEFGIRVNTICPGPIDGRLINEINQRRSEADRVALQSQLGVLDNGRYGTVTEIAECVCFLLSDAASFVTGTAFVADGGRLA